MSTVTTTTSPIAEKSDRGSVRPGSVASSARFATVSRPVYASIASGSANARSLQSWPLAKPSPSPSVSGESRKRDPEHHEDALHEQVEQRDGERAEVETRPPSDPHPCDHGDECAADDGIPRRLAKRRLADRAGEVVGHEERRERHDDEEVEEEHPARHESGEVVERTAHEGRRASGLRQGGGALRVRERDEDEHRTGDEENEWREAERGRRDDPERDVQRRGDLPVRHREERRSVEDALEASELPGHYRTLLRSRVKRATPSATNSAPRT